MIVSVAAQSFLLAQVNDTINEKEVSRIIHYLASDSLKGRGNGSPELLKAAKFIGEEFRKNGLKPFPGFPGYYVSFRPFGGVKDQSLNKLIWNGDQVEATQFMYVHAEPGAYPGRSLENFKVIRLDKPFTDDIFHQYSTDTSSLLIWTNKKQGKGKNIFPDNMDVPAEGIIYDRLLVYADKKPRSLSLSVNGSIFSTLEYNVVGVLPGKIKPEEVIIFSAHYDHEGVYGSGKDSIMNGANDDASGTTALLLLAKYFAARNNNERTIVFCAFAGEELGLVGSNDFVKYIKADKVIAGINIEMIGVPQRGKNRVFITGQKYSDLPRILEKGFKTNKITTGVEPNEKKELFKRSDNFPFVTKGIPFHTIMASDDDDECYHQPCDEVRRIDIPNMTRIIKAIAASAITLVNGKATPKRINTYFPEFKR